MQMRKLRLSMSVGALALATSGAFADTLLDLQKDPRQWVSPTGDYANLRHSALKQITTANVHKLAVDWQFSTGVLRGHEGAPLVIHDVTIPAVVDKDGKTTKAAYVTDVMYLHTPFPNNVYALDLRDPDHKVLWKYTPQQDASVVPVMCCDTVNRGLAYGDGKIFLAQADTTLVALDAATGASSGESKDKPIWSVKFGDPSKGETSTAAPHVFKDKVLVGNAGGEYGVRGHITAYDVKTGALLWRGYSTGPDEETLIDPEKTTHLGKPVGQGLPGSTLGKAISGSSAAARHGAGTATTQSSISSITAPAIPRHGIPFSALATIAGP